MLQQLLLQPRLLQKVARITPAVKGVIQDVMKESHYVNHAIIEIYMTRTANDDSPDVYTLGDRRSRGLPLGDRPPTPPKKKRKERKS